MRGSTPTGISGAAGAAVAFNSPRQGGSPDAHQGAQLYINSCIEFRIMDVILTMLTVTRKNTAISKLTHILPPLTGSSAAGETQKARSDIFSGEQGAARNRLGIPAGGGNLGNERVATQPRMNGTFENLRVTR